MECIPCNGCYFVCMQACVHVTLRQCGIISHLWCPLSKITYHRQYGPAQSHHTDTDQPPHAEPFILVPNYVGLFGLDVIKQTPDDRLGALTVRPRRWSNGSNNECPSQQSALSTISYCYHKHACSNIVACTDEL